MKATAAAHPVQELIKYYGVLDHRVQLPFHDTISVCTAPLETVTTFAFQKEKEICINGQTPDSKTVSRIDAVVSEVKKLSGIEEAYKIVSESNIPGRGLDVSSGVAALTMAAAEAAGLDLSVKELSTIARKGAQSASRSITGWFSRWRANLQREFCYSFVIEDDLQMGMVGVLVEPVHSEVQMLTSPAVAHRLQSVHTLLYEMERAIKAHDIPAIGKLTETDSMLLHGLTTARNREPIVWAPEIHQVIAEVKALREEGTAAYVSIDTGALLYINSYPEDVLIIEERLNRIGVETIQLQVGGGAKSMKKHLF